MRGPRPWGQTYLDVRPATSKEQISLDLTRHLQYRLGTGSILIIADNPRIFLSVIRRRWKSLVREVAKQRSYTIDGRRRHLLAEEVERLQSFCFSSKPEAGADVLVITPEQAAQPSSAYSTLYITTSLEQDFMAIVRNLSTGGLIVAYGEYGDRDEE
jgi:hypothetical protein